MTPMERIEGELSDAQKRITELERERDMHQAAEEAQIALRQKADEREAALAAHVERLRESLELAKNRIALLADVATRKGASVYAAIDIWPQEMMRDLEQTAENSLTRRDLIKQSEALVALYNDCLGHDGDGMVRCAIMLDRAIELREEGEALNE